MQNPRDERTTCIVVDDHEVVRDGMRGRLERLDWLALVGETGTARDARAMITSLEPQLALMDVRLPDGDGLDVARQLIDDGHETRIVLYSGVATTSQAEQALESGVSGFVLKDSSIGAVVDALAAARDGRRYIDPTIAAELMAPNASRPISPRELEILTLMADGRQNSTIAHELGISVETVKAHVSNILAKFQADGRTHAVATALREGIIT